MVTGNVACGGSQWRMDTTFFKCFLLQNFMMTMMMNNHNSPALGTKYTLCRRRRQLPASAVREIHTAWSTSLDRIVPGQWFAARRRVAVLAVGLSAKVLRVVLGFCRCSSRSLGPSRAVSCTASRCQDLAVSPTSKHVLLRSSRSVYHITSHHMENTEAGLQRPLFLRNRLKTTSI